MDELERTAAVVDRTAAWVELLSRSSKRVGVALAALSIASGLAAGAAWADETTAVAVALVVVSVVAAALWLAPARLTSRLGEALGNFASRVRQFGAHLPTSRGDVTDGLRRLADQTRAGGVGGLLRLRHLRKLRSLAVAIGFEDVETITTTPARVVGVVVAAIAASTVVAVGLAVGVVLMLL